MTDALPASDKYELPEPFIDIFLFWPKRDKLNEAGEEVDLLTTLILTKDESIELVSLAHFRGRTFENSIVIVDEFQNLTRSQLRMALGRLGKNSTMIFCGDNQQIDLKDSNYSAIVDLPKIKDSQYVYKRVLEDNHRHEAIDEVFELLNGM